MNKLKRKINKLKLTHIMNKQVKDTTDYRPHARILATNTLILLAFILGTITPTPTTLAETTKIREVTNTIHTTTTEHVYLPPTREQIINEIIDQAKAHNVNPATALTIAKCESNYRPFAIGKNRNGTTDTGVFQINSIHNVPLNDMLDYKKNIKWSMELMQKKGNQPWYSSQHCWN